MLIEKPIIIIQLGFPAKLPFPGVLGDRISGCIVLVSLWSSEPKLYHWVSSLLQPDLPISTKILGLSAPWFRGKVMEVSSFQGKYKNRECQDQKEPKLYHNVFNSEPMISSSSLISACPQLHFLLFPVQWMVPPSTTGSGHKSGGHLSLVCFPHHHPHPTCNQPPMSRQGHSSFSSPTSSTFIQTTFSPLI